MVHREKREGQRIEKLAAMARRQGLTDDQFKRVCWEMFYQYWNTDDYETINQLRDVLIIAYENRFAQRNTSIDEFRALFDCLPKNKTDRYWYCDSCAVQDALVAIYCGIDEPVTLLVWDPKPVQTETGEA
jgi:hypothetical protein